MTAVPGGTSGRTAQTFVESSTKSWGETDVDDLLTDRQSRQGQDKDVQGPVSLGAACQETAEGRRRRGARTRTRRRDDKPRPETRVAVIGDSDFASNYALGIQGNRDLFLNIMSWLAQQENLISIRPRGSG